MKSKLELYALAVCFASVICLVISTGVAGYSLVKIAKPSLTIRAWDYNRLQSNEAFWKSISRSTPALLDNKPKQEARPSEEELTQMRSDELKTVLCAEQRDGFQALLQCAFFIIISVITLFIHWRIAKRARTP